MIDFIGNILTILINLVAIKALTIGSDFNFALFFRYKGVYVQWYFKRNIDEEFKMYLQMTEVNEKVKRY